MKSSEKMWRTLVRVVSLSFFGVTLVIPGWNCKKRVWVCYQAIPPLIFRKMKIGNRYHVGCNIGAKNKNDLCFDNWEKK